MKVKSFDEWNDVKKKVDTDSRAPIKRGEVYWCRVGLNVGVELDGKNEDFVRPVVVLKKYSNEIALCAPLTSKSHKGDWYFNLPSVGSNSFAILNQIKPLDTKRFLSSICQLGDGEVDLLLEAFIKLIKTI